MANTKRIGDRGHPCRTPDFMLIGSQRPTLPSPIGIVKVLTYSVRNSSTIHCGHPECTRAVSINL